MSKLKFILLLCLVFVLAVLKSQVGIGVDLADASAVLEVKSSNKGLLIPRLTNLQRNNILNKPDEGGLTIYNRDTHCVEFWTGSQWLDFICNDTVILDCTNFPVNTEVSDTENNTITLNLPYKDLTGKIVLNDGAVLGSANGLTVKVKGTQTLTSTTGTISVELNGTVNDTNTNQFNILIFFAEAINSCNLSIVVKQTVSSVTLDCANFPATSVLQGINNTVNLSLPYTNLKGTISLTDGTILGSSNGLTVKVNGNQNLTTTIGTISVILSGTVSNTSINPTLIPITIFGSTNTCNLSVTIEVSSFTLDCINFPIDITRDSDKSDDSLPFTLPYTNLKGTISLTDGTILGSSNGLTVKVNGNQTLTTTTGTISVILSGTVSNTSTNPTLIPVTISGSTNTCNLSVAILSKASLVFDCAKIGTLLIDEADSYNPNASSRIFKIYYNSLINGPVSLIDGTVLGTLEGLSIVVNGNQTLSTSEGYFSAKLTGEVSKEVFITIKLNTTKVLSTNTCSINVKYLTNPADELPNSYIVGTVAGGNSGTISAAPNYPIFTFPVTKAFYAWKKDGTNLGQDLNDLIAQGYIASVSVYWEDNNVVSSVSVPAKINASSQITVNLINSKTTSAYDCLGNALIVLRIGPSGGKSDPIYWSWHIWHTGNRQPESFAGSGSMITGRKFMGYALGEIPSFNNDTPEETTKLAPLGVYYQWGRKDPFPANIYAGEITKIKSAGSNNIIASVNTPAISFSGGVRNWFNGSSLIQNNLWGGANSASTGTKTIYDPCPKGWKVPTHMELFAKSPDYTASTTGVPLSGSSTGTYFTYGKVAFRSLGSILADTPGQGRNYYGIRGLYWTSTADVGHPNDVYIYFQKQNTTASTSASIIYTWKQELQSVRCTINN